MHGRKKLTRELTAEEKAEKAKKLAKYHALFRASFAVCKARSMTPEAFKLNTKMLAANPDFYSIWNHRREMLLHMFEGKNDEQLGDLAAGELRLTKLCIAERNPKSYCAWFHRKWIVDRGHCSLEHELALCKKLLMHDERNFHCWNYRRWVAAKAGVPPEAELEFAKEKIMYNFSNYSAWHYRSKLLPKVSPLTAETLNEELELLQDAIYTEAADQSLWMYHRWLLSELASHHGDEGADVELIEEAMATQLSQCMELADAMEADGESSKWPRLAQAYLLRLMHSIGASEAVEEATGAPAGEGATVELFGTIAEMDPHHKHFYAYAAQAQSPMLGDLSAAAPQPTAPATEAGVAAAQGQTVAAAGSGEGSS